MKLLDRVHGLLTNPDREWAAIAEDELDPGAIYGQHISILAAIPAIAILVGLAIAGGRYLGSTAIVTAVTAAMVGYVIALAVPIATAAALAAMAPRFKSDAGINETLKLVAYSLTPFWIAGAFYTVVSLSPLVFVGLLYSVYLLFLGVKPVMSAPAEQRVPITLVATISFLLVTLVIGMIVQQVRLPYYGF